METQQCCSSKILMSMRGFAPNLRDWQYGRESGHKRILISTRSKKSRLVRGSFVSIGIAAKLRRIRQQWQLSLREAEERSLRFAQEQGDQSYQVSASWLTAWKVQITN
jgi:hypothetical protein